MNAARRFGSGFLLAALAWGAGSAPAAAQFGQGTADRNRQNGITVPVPPGSPVPGHHGHNRPQVRILPPEPLFPGSPGLIERDFQAMRRTSPNPNNFLYGRWNPRVEIVTPSIGVYPGYGNSYPYYGGGYYYNQYPYGYSNFGFFGYPQQTITQREVYILRDRGYEEPQPERRREQPREEERARDTERRDDFYLRGQTGGENITDALDDIRKAWLNGDTERLRARFRLDGKVRIYPNGQYEYALSGREFADLLADAMKRIDTLSFELDRPKSGDSGRVFVTGKHVFTDGDKTKQETHVSYTLEKIDGRWKIVEAGSSSAPIAKHTE